MTDAYQKVQAIQKQQDFYRLSISAEDAKEIKRLMDFSETLKNPELLRKLIWSEYFQKQTVSLCKRVLGDTKTCGIYKITNINTNQCYIGQSVDIAERWQQHIKCGLGIKASSTNKLYKAMMEDGIQNFTFELLQADLSKAELNAKEKFYIELYNSKNLGYNTTGGNNG